MKKIKYKIISLIYDYLYIPVFFGIVFFRDWKKIKSIFGDFEYLSKADQKKYTLVFKKNSKNVCGLLVPEIVKAVSELNLHPKKVLLDGDNKSVANQFKDRFGFVDAKILTTGIDRDYDFHWNFENDPPENIQQDFDLIISQAMFEHLIDPFKHFKDLSNLLSSEGYLIIHSHLPGYAYHRYPIDAVRFFPDWFEFAAKKLGLKVIRKFFRNFHIVYLFKKPI